MTIIIMTELKLVLIFLVAFIVLHRMMTMMIIMSTMKIVMMVLFLMIRMINLEVFLWTDDYDHKVSQELLNYRLTGATKCFFEERTEGQSELTPTENLGFKGFQKCC